MDAHVLSKFGTSIIAVFTFNLISKLVSFFGNIIIVRLSDALLLGEAFQYEVWFNTWMFLCREPIRNATQRFVVRNAADTQHVMNCGFCSVPVYLILVTTASWFLMMPGGVLTMALWVLAGLVEALAEPYAILAVTLMSFHLKARIEGFALVLRMLITTLVLFLWPYSGSMAYAWAQVASSLAIALLYLYYGKLNPRASADVEWEGHVNLVRYVRPSAGIPRPMIITILHMVGECFLRLVLTEGEKVVLWVFATTPDMGVYRVVSHLVSIVCRLVFKFLEDVSFTAWSKLLSSTPQHTSSALHMLRTLLRAVNLFGLAFVTFGVPYSHTALLILFGAKWASDPSGVPIMRAYCVYVLLLGGNGLLEAFFRAAASPAWLRHSQGVMVVCSVVYVSSCIGLMRGLDLGVVGLVWANCLSMALRVLYCAYFLSQYIPTGAQRSQVLRGALGMSPVVLGTCCGACLWPLYVTPAERGFLLHVTCGVLWAVGFVVSVYVSERPLLMDLRRILTNKD